MTKQKNCRTCKSCDKIFGDYLLQCKNPEVRKWYGDKWNTTAPVSLQSAAGKFCDDSPCGQQLKLFSPIINPLTWIKRKAILKSEGAFWKRTQERYGGPLGNPLGKEKNNG